MKDPENLLAQLNQETRQFVEMRIEQAIFAQPQLSISSPLPYQGTNSVVFAAQWNGSPAVRLGEAHCATAQSRQKLDYLSKHYNLNYPLSE